MLRLGDRHTPNILMDNNSGEIVHIDLGIAFDRAPCSSLPYSAPSPRSRFGVSFCVSLNVERVPFRLIADMVDGLGISGVQGVFQRCAEEALRVLRVGSVSS